MKELLSGRRIEMLEKLSNMLGLHFTDIGFLHQALIHTSFANEYRGVNVVHNERLEFLGDAVLDLVISEYLFCRFSNLPEGELTKARSAIVCETTLAERAGELEIGEYLLLGKGEANSGGHKRTSILADAFEAVIGAVYLDQGFAVAADFIKRQLVSSLELIEQGEYLHDYKTLLQEIMQRNGECKIAYEIVDERGPDHNKEFIVSVRINGEEQGCGAGKSKKEAEQRAARQALSTISV